MIILKGKLHFNYNGKPNPGLIAKVTRLAKNSNGEMVLVEYDRAGAFRVLVRNLPWKPPYSVMYHHPLIAEAYYPWAATIRGFFDPWMAPCYPKKIIRKSGKCLFVYSPHKETTGENLFLVGDYLKWRSQVLRKYSK